MRHLEDIADALIDELVREPFTKRLSAGSETDGVLSDGQALGNHGLRLDVRSVEARS
jgi:hypothetical protein